MTVDPEQNVRGVPEDVDVGGGVGAGGDSGDEGEANRPAGSRCEGAADSAVVTDGPTIRRSAPRDLPHCHKSQTHAAHDEARLHCLANLPDLGDDSIQGGDDRPREDIDADESRAFCVTPTRRKAAEEWCENDDNDDDDNDEGNDVGVRSLESSAASYTLISSPRESQRRQTPQERSLFVSTPLSLTRRNDDGVGSVSGPTAHTLRHLPADEAQVEQSQPQNNHYPSAVPAPVQIPQQHLIHRLRILLDEIISVLRSYAATLNPSAPRVQSLHAFYDRVYDLLHPTSSDLFCVVDTDDSDSDSNSDSTGTERRRRSRRREVLASDVERLEREWWTSEVVAAWYGPSRIHHTPVVAAGRNGAVGAEANARDREVVLRRDASYVGLYDE